jgi:deazaflavin-dependent oxidoreductase (nitroreductase family)
MTSSQPNYLYLTTRGRRTGEPREIEIWFTQHDGRYYVIAEYETSHWVRNVRADPRVQIKVGESQTSARAWVLDQQANGELIRTVQALSRQKYGWGDGLVVEFTPG